MSSANFFGLAIWLAVVAAVCAVVIYCLVLVIKALKKYLNTSSEREEKKRVCRSLGEAIRENRIRCKMTQEFVAESLGVSRQAVSKWNIRSIYIKSPGPGKIVSCGSGRIADRRKK